MCGIAFIIASNNAANEDIQRERAKIARGVRDRGGDAYAEVDIESINGVAIGSVLHMRGETVVTQPIKDEDGKILLWNGELFGGIDVYREAKD